MAHEPKEPEPEEGEPLFMATFRLQNTGVENRARSLERIAEGVCIKQGEG